MTTLKTDCRFFRGMVPCKPHKVHRVHCVDTEGRPCPYYDRAGKEILIIKLGAIGDVIRTTPLLRKLKEVHPDARIWWLTLTPEILPSVVDEPLGFTLQSTLYLQSRRFDLLLNLDKDREACALAELIAAGDKKGFRLDNGVVVPATPEAEPKYLTGLFDDAGLANTTSYPREIFDMCGFPFSGEKYLLDRPAPPRAPWKLNKNKRVIGLNTGCGARWTSRLWDDRNWIALARELKRKGYEVVLLGGEQEHTKNNKIARAAKVKYFGHAPLQTFMSLIDRCDLVVTGVTMAMHVTIGLGRKIVLINNIFNKHEFELYGLGEIVEPEKPCRCFYQPVCTNAEYRCMEHLPVRNLVHACERVLGS
jgi:ADP-heptose:LPS heptosyltransferase